jgi:hypothetical protein
LIENYQIDDFEDVMNVTGWKDKNLSLGFGKKMTSKRKKYLITFSKTGN